MIIDWQSPEYHSTKIQRQKVRNWRLISVVLFGLLVGISLHQWEL